jgi:GH24 family phage-related lysozyme (muramidase)
MADPDLIHPSVREAFLPLSVRFEGSVSWLYQDIKGLVTVAVGVLVDPLELALDTLDGHMVRKLDGDPATRHEIAADWQAIKRAPDLARRGHRAAESVAWLRLTPEGLEAVALRKLDAMAAQLARRFPQLPAWPASAQLAVLSLAWACGAGFHFPKTERALLARDWATAAEEGVIDATGNPGVVPRNAANRALWLAAAHVEATGGDPAALLWEPPAPPQIDRGAVLGLVASTLDASVVEGLDEARRGR